MKKKSTPAPTIVTPDGEAVAFISWACQCGAYGNVEASKTSAKYRLHRGKMTSAGLQPAPGHGLTKFLIFDQLRTAEEIHEPKAAA